MNLSLQKDLLADYVSKQINNFFPDNNLIGINDVFPILDLTLDRLNFCFKHVNHTRYQNNNQTIFNHLYSDHYLMFLWYLSNTSINTKENSNLSNKLYYLNKTLHGFDCMYDTKMPDIFLVFHGVGTMLGKAEYADFFIALQGCTIGSHKGCYPKMEKGVSLTAHSSIIGNCNVGKEVSISAYTNIFEQDIPSNSVVFKNSLGVTEIKTSKTSYAKQFFHDFS
jgi:serine O-acetyltransferase